MRVAFAARRAEDDAVRRSSCRPVVQPRLVYKAPLFCERRGHLVTCGALTRSASAFPRNSENVIFLVAESERFLQMLVDRLRIAEYYCRITSF
jgi:hypothetical protein